MIDFTQILDNIWIGNLYCVLNNKFLNYFNISAIVNVTKINYRLNNSNKKINYIQLPINDSNSYIDNMHMFMSLNRITNFIRENIIQGRNVFIHCEHGFSRSPSVLAAYLMRYHKLNIIKSIIFIKEKRNKCFKKIRFKFALEKYYKHITN